MLPETRYIDANGITIAYETFGDPSAPPVLLVTGLSVQMLAWPERLCEQLADNGFHVIRTDNRDVGLSTHLDHERRMSTADILRRRGPYAIADMAEDVAGLISGLDLGPVHLVGASMGGFISQTVAINHPEMVRTLTLIMTSTGSRRVGWPRRDVAWRIARRRVAANRADAIEMTVQILEVIGSPGYPLDTDMIRDIASRSFDREYDSAGRSRQLAAVIAQPNRTKELAGLTMPTLVVHGLADPVVSVSGGLALARAIPGAKFVGYSGMGHDVPRGLWHEVVGEIVALTQRVK